MIGMMFGHYRILGKIGQGGMGEVYLADDTSLQRKVALKFLPPEMQQNASARHRFMREAKSAAALDHPYICHINEVSEAEAIERLELSLQFDSRASPERLAFAYRKLGKLRESAEKYEEFVAWFGGAQGAEVERGILAHYELAQIYRELGDTQMAKEYYGKFLNIWKDAEADIPILNKARAEYAKFP